MGDGDGGYGQLGPWETNDDTNIFVAAVRALIARLDTMKLVKVLAVKGGGPSAAPPTVDVQPLVNQVDGLGHATPQGPVYGIPVARLQGGTGAIVLDPGVGDVGYVVCADRDSSSAVRTKTQANPGSNRAYDVADAVYVGGILNAAPTQFISFSQQGLAWQDASGNTIVSTATGINLTPASGQPVTVTGPLIVTGTSDLKGNVTAEGTLSVTGALQAASLGLNATGKITRIITATFSQAVSFAPDSGQQQFNFAVAGVQAGDFVVAEWTGTVNYITSVWSTSSGFVVLSSSNPGNVAVAGTISGNLLIIGTT